MIPIQVLGSGMIPRGYGLAPRTKPFMADRLLVGTIMSTPGLTVNFVNPETGAVTKITSQNMDRIINKWSGWTGKKATSRNNEGSPVPPVNGSQIKTDGGITPNAHSLDQKPKYEPPHAPGTVLPNTDVPVESKGPDAQAADETKKTDESSGSKKDETPADAVKADDKKDAEATDEQKTAADVSTSQKNNGFKPMAQNGQNNQGKNNRK